MSADKKTLRIGIVAGEASGDILGAALLAALRQQAAEQYQAIQIEGIGGPLMLAEGCTSFFPQDRLAVMGLVEPLKRLPELLRIRRFLKSHFMANPPDVFIGIDSPDFNLNLECALREAGIKTVHYVSPSVWAWRQGRLKKIAHAVDLVLTLFPFEERFYRAHAAEYPTLKSLFVGHPLADSIPLHTDTAAARAALQLPVSGTCMALLPGSRAGEVARMARLFFEVARRCYQINPRLLFIVPAANAAREQQLRDILIDFSDVPIRLMSGQSQCCMAASDAVLMASGTTTLEAMLLKKPMVVAYKMAPLTAAILSRLIKVPYVALPNLLADKMLVPEFLQKNATVGNLSTAVLALLQNEERIHELQKTFFALHEQLRRNASTTAAHAVLQLAEKH